MTKAERTIYQVENNKQQIAKINQKIKKLKIEAESMSKRCHKLGNDLQLIYSHLKQEHPEIHKEVRKIVNSSALKTTLDERKSKS